MRLPRFLRRSKPYDPVLDNVAAIAKRYGLVVNAHPRDASSWHYGHRTHMDFLGPPPWAKRKRLTQLALARLGFEVELIEFDWPGQLQRDLRRSVLQFHPDASPLTELTRAA